MMFQPYIIAALPAYNEEHHIESIINKARQYVTEVIVVDDGSNDGTAERARAAGARVVSHSINKGYGEAIKTCFAAAQDASADVLVILDADGQHNSEEIPHLLEPIIQEEADLTIGSRFIANHNHFPAYRKFGISVITSLWNVLSDTRVTDTQSGFRAYRLKYFEKMPLSASGMSLSVEILELARRRHAAIKEIPISCFYQPSRLNWAAVKHGLGVALAVLLIRLRYSLPGYAHNGHNGHDGHNGRNGHNNGNGHNGNNGHGS